MADRISRLSGRGVGLDVVRKRIEGLGGTVHIVDQPLLGGTTFRLILPLSLLSIKGLLVNTLESICALPIECVVRTLRIDRQEFQRMYGQLILIRKNKEPLKIYWLNAIMAEKTLKPDEKLSIVVLSHRQHEIGLVVQDVIGEQEFVTKPLPWNLKKVPYVNGAVILGDGALAIVIDVPQIFAATPETDVVPIPAKPIQPSISKARILVVDDSLTSRTLERNILQSAGYEVVVAVDGQEAWEKMNEQKIHLVVSDVQMPRMDGIEFTRRIRQSTQYKIMPVILVSNLGSETDLGVNTSRQRILLHYAALDASLFFERRRQHCFS